VSGFLAILHTWTQRLKLHFHLHCIVPGGVWRAAAEPLGGDGREDSGQWVPRRSKWLFREESLADAFRNRFLRRLCSLRKRGNLAYKGRAAPLADEAAWEQWRAPLASQSWIVFSKPTPDDPTQALDYVARYTHKVAIGDSRIKALQDGRVTYTWRDRSEDNVQKTETIPVEVFTRRFLAHILPDGFHKIRYFGWMAAARRKAILAAIRQALHVEPPPASVKESLAARVLRRSGVDITLCPHCGQGHLRKTDRILLPHRGQAP
jgi:hypothetical protein